MGLFDKIKFNKPKNPEAVLDISLDQLLAYRTRRNNLVENIGDSLREFKPGILDSDRLASMLRNGVIDFGLSIVKAPLISIFKKATFESNDPVVKAFLQQELHPVIMNSLPTILTSLEYGVSFHEKIFKSVLDLEIEYEKETDDEDGNTISEQTTTVLPTAIVYDQLRFNPFKTIERIELDRDTQDFKSYVQRIKESGGMQKDVEVDAWKSFVFAFKSEETLWGKTILEQAYPSWYSYELASGYHTRHLQHASSPPLIGHAPVGTTTTTINGVEKEVSNIEFLTIIASNAGSSDAIIFPAEFDLQTGNPRWMLKQLDIGDRSDLFRNALAWLERTILISILAPQQAAGQRIDETGSFSVGEIEFEAFLISEFTRIETLATAINNWLIEPLVLLNFGENFNAQIIVPDITKEITSRYFQIVNALIKAKHPDVYNYDGIALGENLGIPINKTRDIMDIMSPNGDEDESDEDEDESSEDDSDSENE